MNKFSLSTYLLTEFPHSSTHLSTYPGFVQQRLLLATHHLSTDVAFVQQDLLLSHTICRQILHLFNRIRCCPTFCCHFFVRGDSVVKRHYPGGPDVREVRQLASRAGQPEPARPASWACRRAGSPSRPGSESIFLSTRICFVEHFVQQKA